MGKIAVIMIIRYPNIDDRGLIESRVDTLYNDNDDTMIEWIRTTISKFLESEELDFEDYEQFLDDYYPYDSEDATHPFRVSYYDIKDNKWRYLEDDFMHEILYNWHTPDDIDMDNIYNDDNSDNSDNEGYYNDNDNDYDN